ncbi:DUF2325 domain-containing protein [Aquabacterium sp. J223]|uniref:DUF2325 domain-containing protein n=1 Tax=Aquabacterium sp. J223 TaxID=2898431 RepID=UPI0021AD5A9B|nr:DUF2325 domain-containing protein [Aquabacterium sp. J223]UUX94105.1 DUF2325 domain-containing protein [Aquabacterium sp. J223]
MATSFIAPVAAPDARPATEPLALLGRRPSPVAAAEPAGSRRRRLWELDGHAHCPVVGMCLPMPALRRLMGRLSAKALPIDEYELHCMAVQECKRRTPLAEALQRDLDRRFAGPLRDAAACKSTEALAAWWTGAAASEAVPGAFWATITHARCDVALADRVLGAVHMLQHQVGSATRADLQRLAELVHENGVLGRELAAAQQRCQRQVEQHARRAEADARLLGQLRGELAARDAELLRLQALHAAAPDLPTRFELQQRNGALADEVHALQRALLLARQDHDRLQRRHAALTDELQALQRATATTDGAAATTPAPASLHDRAVLCVGGRPAIVPVYRQVVEGSGGRFLHHDGGDEDHIAQLEATLAAADLVLCQTGCVSHDAYWRVKDHCKRTGKRCVFVETPSRTALQRALDEAARALQP